MRDSERARDKRVANNSELMPNEGKLRDRTHADVVLRSVPRVKKGGLKMEGVHGSANREVDPLVLEVAADPNAPPPPPPTTTAAAATATTAAAASTTAAASGDATAAAAADTVRDVEMK